MLTVDINLIQVKKLFSFVLPIIEHTMEKNVYVGDI